MEGNVRAAAVVGITGKRDLRGKDEAVREALRQAFGTLDTRFPHTPKILLSALAEGADTLAAEEALARSSWHVVAPLPLCLELYLQDFSQPAAVRLRGLIENPRVRVIELDPLIDPSTKSPFSNSALTRRPDGANANRALHYEQVGLYIAQRCALMLAVMADAEEPDRIGGTARIVDYRLRGQPDRTARQVLEHSSLLRQPIPLDQADTGPVWLVDLDTVKTGQGELSRHVHLPGADKAGTASANPHSLERSLLLIGHIDDFNRRASARSTAQTAEPTTTDSVSILRQLRSALSAIQVKKNRLVRFSVHSLAWLFFSAILALEAYGAFNRFAGARWAIVGYVVLLLAAIGLYDIARRRAWQPIAEDYRAVAEALRVQIVWWEAGLVKPEHRVDRFYLSGAGGSLALVRAALCHIIDAASLQAEIPKPEPTSQPETGWIQGQIKFFVSRIAARRAQLSRVEASSWFLIMLAVGPAASLAALQIGSLRIDLHERFQSFGAAIRPAIFVAATVAVLAICGWTIPRWSAQMAKLGEKHGRMLNARRFGLAFSTGLLVTVGLMDLGAWMQPHLLTWMQPMCDPQVQEAYDCSKQNYYYVASELLIMASVLPAAFAGMRRFIAEKLSWEAEVNGYEEILGVFRRAQAELMSLTADDPPSARAQIILELGKEALEENEAWIRKHRERPLEPLLGG